MRNFDRPFSKLAERLLRETPSPAGGNNDALLVAELEQLKLEVAAFDGGNPDDPNAFAKVDAAKRRIGEIEELLDTRYDTLNRRLKGQPTSTYGVVN